MFNIGAKVVYPMHGAGVIRDIEERLAAEKVIKYYVLSFWATNMVLWLPVEKVERVGLRPVIDREKVDLVFSVLKEGKEKIHSNWNKRYKSHVDKIKSNDILAIADVVRDLRRREKEKGLSTGEKKLLESARQILVSELILVLEEEEDKVLAMVERAIAQT
ncbi:CarD family transcriptional regulator [Carboxydothermus pertinax]|uniref:CarD family transcriptional regulator n=1 Tax=Carboxydothermus pertinax TaxID=870242 RepID=A0A1L8CWB0_9THEO|nr:CarD family transcriptional regulator [Carboxydothermus pertinax]GAV23139.1 CarD family transcriptional regulator [Carboxydothermus pertinax]